ncbi:molybdopterin molybdenumtransferase MoeA [Streptomyces sp. WZ.A104]|uniref:molybdopterin molybdotransferase MoeA n=1 Tax=Streptomyces sp. WZ.A104 TaxID=2023771 RepID=UPI000BBCD903|nr:molybdopterin molybdotransferase MoeA [Streptomyces sp. WZ.A104]PCG84155.1 molybdopterin molybdenumtransferase MoeA [Streptomyces sp. WZ.A104]
MTAPHSPGPESGRGFSAAGSGSDLARAAEEQAVEQALALVGGGSWDPGRDQARDPGRDPSKDLGKDPGSDPGRDLGREPSRGMSDGPGSGSRGGLGNGPSGSISESTGGSTADDPHTNSNGSPSDGTLGPVSPAPTPHAPPLPWERARAVAARAGRGGPGAVIRLPLDRALGHVLAEALGALTDLPSFDTSAMDGWAVAGPGPWAYESGAGLLAGRREPSALSDGNAVRIATGARVPPDTTAVIRSEHAHVDEAKGLLHARRPVVTGQDIRPRGQECRSGEQLVPAGTVVTPAVLGLAAAAGYDALPVVPRPRVDILVLGDELLAAGLPHDGLIRDALGPMLGPWLRALGAEVSGPVRLGDDAGALREAIIASDADVIVTTGGTAAGPVDHVHVVLDGLGAELLVDGVAVRPGHPMLLARLPASGQPDGPYTRQDEPYTRQDGTCSQQDGPHPYLRPDGPYLVGLPGNPLAAVSGLLTLAEPLLAGIAGRPDQDVYRALVHAEVPGHPRDTRLVPVVHRAGGAGGRDHVAPLRYNGPAMLRGIAAADGLAVVPPGGVRSGTEVEILDLPWAPATPWTEGCFT